MWKRKGSRAARVPLCRAVMATCGPGETIIVARNAHLSAFNAMVLAGAQG